MKKINVILPLLLLVFIVIEIALYVGGQAPLTNRIDRAMSGAPDVHLMNTELLFHGEYELAMSELKPHATSEEGTELYKLKDIADENMQPPYLYVLIPGDDQHVYRYSFPKGIGF